MDYINSMNENEKIVSYTNLIELVDDILNLRRINDITLLYIEKTSYLIG